MGGFIVFGSGMTMEQHAGDSRRALKKRCGEREMKTGMEESGLP
ncbi:hypothetical protein [Herbaspirillum autotrophicum]|jgi:hypothetical protein|nr:hypothetical protein [Herbaspirillum autotrophicum]